jgi:hypothetical protein
MHTPFWLKSLKEIEHLEEIGVDGKIILQEVMGITNHSVI